jgi:hypothetical protein
MRAGYQWNIENEPADFKENTTNVVSGLDTSGCHYVIPGQARGGKSGITGSSRRRN